MTTPFFRARVRRSSVVELIVIVTIVIINRRLRRRRDWRDWDMANSFRGNMLKLLACPHTLFLDAWLAVVSTPSNGICRIAHRSSSVHSHDDENTTAPIVTGTGFVALGRIPSR